MRSVSNRAISLLGLIIFLGVLICSPTACAAGGSSVETAPIYGPGTYSNEVLTNDQAEAGIFYNVTCRVGANLTVVRSGSTSLTMQIMAPNGTVLDDDYGSFAAASIICDSNQQYTIMIYNPDGPTGDTFTLLICLDNDCGSSEIIGFDLFFTILGISQILGLLIFYRSRTGVGN